MTRPKINRRYVLMARWSLPLALLAAAIGYAALNQSDQPDAAAPNTDGTIAGLTNILARQLSPDAVRVRFDEVAADTGITTRHFPHVRRSLLPEDMGSGLAWGDYDDDGDQDLFIVNFKASIVAEARSGDRADAAAGRCALYRNDGDGTFTEVGAAAGLDVEVFGMGAAWGDYDNDDDLDLAVTCYGPNLLFRNNGDGTFTESGAAAAVDDEHFGAGAAWADFDRDGWIDLYVCNYVQFERRESDRSQTARQYTSEIPYTINPSAYAPEVNRLYRNNGDGTFTDVAEAAGVANVNGRSLAAAWFDFNDDGWVDLYVANDVSENGVYLNRGDGTFEDIGPSSLAADYRGAMGVATADVDRDGDLDMLVTHWLAQENAYYENMTAQRWLNRDGHVRVFFMDSAERVGLGYISLHIVGWATGFPDFDNDGWSDLWVVNGSTLEQDEDHAALKPQRVQVFVQEPDKGFFEVGAAVCATLQTPVVGRGGGHADYDGDGRMDLAVLVHGGTPLLLHNTTEPRRHWLTVCPRQSGFNTRALGARVMLRCGAVTQVAQVGADGPYLSQSQMDVHFGLGDVDHV
ncbi:MAG: CRTAC1 family protein, partial [Phycisphaerales bacterium]|nr:CRTAC1 family protein [Phycisphaerales bacterium]